MLDCWKNSCDGATVVPTIAMISNDPSAPRVGASELVRVLK
jgi:hypothetical protein